MRGQLRRYGLLAYLNLSEALLLLAQACLIVAMITILEWSGRQKR
jgi:hypothetical protein